MIFVAHAGHWLASVLYISPVLAVVGLLAIAAIRERRRSGGRRGRSTGAPGA